jgi:hypothetical protein
LSGEVFNQLDLIVGERAHFGSIDADAADRHLIMDDRDCEQCAHARFISTGYQYRVAFDVAFFLANIDNVDWTPSLYRARGCRARSWPKSGLQDFEETRWHSKRENNRLENAIG